jgi:hypothetical protein
MIFKALVQNLYNDQLNQEKLTTIEMRYSKIYT